MNKYLGSMAQISRAYKFEVPVLIRVFCRNYNHQRREYTYYEILHISPSATQKEIKDAYIKLSKQVHPDSGNKGNHAEFVKINQAYNVLSKKQSRCYYDNNLKYNNIHTGNFHQHTGFNNNYKEWKASYGLHPRKYKEKDFAEEKVKAIRTVVIAMIIGTVLQLIVINRYSGLNRRRALQRSAKIQLELETIKQQNIDKTWEEYIQSFEERNRNDNISSDDK